MENSTLFFSFFSEGFPYLQSFSLSATCLISSEKPNILQVNNFDVLLRCVDDINQGLDEINESRGPQDAVLHAVQARDPGARVSRQQQLQQARGEVGERGRCIKSIMVGLINF